jgi:hypothetical protein
MATNGVDKSSKLLSPTELCHIVLKTSLDNNEKMVDFYLKFLGK